MRLAVEMEQRIEPVPLEASEDARRDEAWRSELLARVVDCTVRQLRDDLRMTRVRAAALVDTARLAALDLFPGSEATYNLLLAPRFTRLLDERFGPSVDARVAVVLPFRRRSA
jgi:hypothetical protein